MEQSLTSFDIRDTVDYTLIHDVQDRHWEWFIESAAPEDGDLILDCGCGYGDCIRKLLTLCNQSCFIVDLLDESYVQLDRAKKELASIIAALGDSPSSRSVLNYINTPAEKYSRQSRRKYDKIFLKMVLHEISKNDQKAFLDALFGMLKPGGVLIVWDLALNPNVAPVFRNVVKEKDRLLGFETLVQRRYFLTEGEFLDLAKASSFGVAETAALFDCDFYSKRRIECEFKNDLEKYRTWLHFIKENTSAFEGRSESPNLLKWEQESTQCEHVHFVIQRAIWRLRKPDCLSVFSTISGVKQIEAHLAPSSERKDIAEHIQTAVRGGIQALGEHQLLSGHRGLVRVTTFDLKDKGRRVLRKDGTDYVYSFGEKLDDSGSRFVPPLLNAYYGHMAYTYHRKAKGENGGASLTDFLNERGKMSPNASWLRILAPLYDTATDSATIEVTLCRGAEEIIRDVLVVSGFAGCRTLLLKAYLIPVNSFGCDSLNEAVARVKCTDGVTSVDAIAESEIATLSTAPFTHSGFVWKHQRLQNAPSDALLGFAIFMENAGLKYGSYILPPTPLDSPDGRSTPAAVFFSSDRVLTHQQEQILYAFTSKMWAEMRALELLSASHAFLNTAYREEIQNESLKREFFAKNIVLPLLCQKAEKIDAKLLISLSDESPTGDIYNQWAAAQPAALTCTDLGALLEYLYAEHEGLTTAELQTINAIRHDFANKAETFEDYALKIDAAIGKAQMGGFLFSSIVELLKTTSFDIREFDFPALKEKCQKVIIKLNALENSDRSLIKKWCLQNQRYPEIAEKVQDHILYSVVFRNSATPPFRFPLSDFGAAVAALGDNAKCYNSSGYSLRYKERKLNCEIMWLEVCNKAWTLATFQEAVVTSAKSKGIHRGLPRVILFALESRVKSIDVFAESEWHRIWPLDSKPTEESTQEKKFNYGLRFTF